MTWVKWIVAYIFDCAHRQTTWPHRSRTGLEYVCCLDCGREFPYSTQQMTILWKEKELKHRNQDRCADLGAHGEPVAFLQMAGLSRIK
jgi:hypothetical protein